MFQGMSGISNIIFNNTAQTWSIISMLEKNITNRMVLGIYKDNKKFPVGLRPWLLKGNCNQSSEDFNPVTLKLNKVRNYDFFHHTELILIKCLRLILTGF